MVFSSITFLFTFLPFVLALYYVVPNNFKNVVLCLSSLFFYAWGETVYVFIMIASAVVDYLAGLIIEKGHKKVGLVLSMVFNLFVLSMFKYLSFFAENIYQVLQIFHLRLFEMSDVPKLSLPLGISFYTFQTMSYTIDVYRGEVKANKNFIQFATYVTMFPQLVAGPIVRYIDVQKQIIQKNISLDNFSEGIRRFIIGFAKKLILANGFAFIADKILACEASKLSTFYVWVAVLSYAFQIYYDFSGYSDMAIGLGKMFGFDFLENFNLPYISKSIREFWRRWHISLSSWFRDYVYIPLGGSKVSVSKMYRNLLIVFFVTGLWHGASWNFIVWGLFHGLFIVIERVGFAKKLDSLPLYIQHVYTLLIVLIGWVFFRATDLTHALDLLSTMFIYDAGDSIINNYLNLFIMNWETVFVFVFGIIFSLPLTNFQNQIFKFFHTETSVRIIQLSSLMVLFLISITYLFSASYNPFIYFRF